MAEVAKYKKDGRVAVLYSPGYGAGWSTWISDPEAEQRAIFDPDLAKLLENKASPEELMKKAKENYPSEYLGGVEQLQIQWIYEGTDFQINEYDGSESVECSGHVAWNRA